MAVVAVDPVELRSAAAQVRVVADRVARAATMRPAGLTVPGQRGWQSAGQLASAAGAWADHLRDVAAGFEELAADLGGLEDLLVAADRAAAEVAA